jgi:hypothetical protein
MKLKFKHNQKPTDIYYSNLEEAYGNLPVPSDDYAEMKEVFRQAFISEVRSGELEVQEHFYQLEQAIETIREHYEMVAKALRKEQKYG